MGEAAADHAAARRCREIVTTSGALASIEALIAEQVAVADEALAGLDPSVARTLAGMTRLLTARDA